ncbi:MAG: aldo/keto reductase [Halanaerobiaceae bacterium]
MNSLTLKSGDKIPILGLGTWQLKGEDCIKGVKNALELGYTHIDTAKIYGNHREVAEGIKRSEVRREDIFVTTKVWNDSHEYDQVINSGKEFLKELKIDYIDLLLIHWPVEEVPVEETLEAMQELKDKGIVKNIGVSNFMIEHLEEALAKTSVDIVNNQIKFNPYEYPQNLLEYCKKKNITVTAYSPLARGKIFNDNIIKKLSEKYNHSPAQLVLKWIIEKEVIVIPKATSREHIKDNMKLFDWELPGEVKQELDNLKK